MNFIVSSSVLSRQLSRIAGAIPSKSVLPLIENFLFDLGGNVLTVSTTNLDTSMQTRLNVETRGGDMRVAVPAKILQDILKALPEQPITFTVAAENFAIEILTDNAVYKIAGESAQDFPTIPIPEADTPSVRMPLSALLRAVGKTLFAASTDEDKAALNGMLFDLGANAATFVATDAHRLVRYRRVDVTVETPTSFIVPQKALTLLKSSLDASDNRDLNIFYTQNNAFFQTESYSLVCRLIDQKYPDYERVIPANNPNKLFVSKSSLLGSLKRVNIFASKSTHLVRFGLSGMELLISSEDPDYQNAAREHLKCHFEGEDTAIGFNAQLLQDIIANLDTEDAILELSEPNHAALVLPSMQEDGENLLMLVMPIMLNSYA